MRSIRHFSSSSYAYRLDGFGIDRCQQEIIRALRNSRGPVFVTKRDISDFFASVDHRILLNQLEELVEPDDFLYRLLHRCIEFEYYLNDQKDTASQGIPFGTSIACFFANLYLMQLDQNLEKIGTAKFFRYADDLLVLSPNQKTQHRVGEIFSAEMNRLQLSSKPSHQKDFQLSPSNGNAVANHADRFRHLGLEFRADGSVGLSRDKYRKVCNLFRFAFRRNQRRFKRVENPEKRARIAIEIANKTLDQGVRNVAIVDYYLKHVTDESQLKHLDHWLAEEVLSLAFKGGHKKGYFRRLPFSRLREFGLPSLVHRRRLILHRKIESPFFIWKSRKAQRGYGGKTARPTSQPT